jgi:hypothetical protein
MSACALARAKLAQFVAGLKPQTALTKAGTLAKAGYLASVTGLERNVLSNLTFGIGLNDLAIQPVALVLDHLQAQLRSAATFGKMKPHEARTFASSLDVGGLNAVTKGVRDGTAEAVQLMRTGVDAAGLNEKFAITHVRFENPVIDKAIHGVFNVLEASDRPFFGYAFQRSLYQRAKLMGIRAGYTGARLTKEVDRLLASPTDGMVLGATDDASYATYKNRTPLSELAAGARQRIEARSRTESPGKRLGYQAAGLGMDVVLPFTKVGSAIVNATADLVPGVASVKAVLHEAFDKDPHAHGAHVQAAAKGAAGAALIAAGFQLYKNGNIALDAKSPAERAQYQAEGKQDFSIKVNGRWRTIMWLGPTTPLVMLGAFLAKHGAAQKAGESPPEGAELAAEGAAFTGKVLTEQAYLQNVKRMIDALSGGAGAGRALLSAVTPTPTIVGQARTVLDPSQRVVGSQTDAAANATPGASRTLPERADVFGRPVPRRAPGVRGVLETLLDPSHPMDDRSSPAMRELDRLGVYAGTAPPKVRVGRRSIDRSPAERAQMQAEYGPVLLAALEQVVSDPSYLSAPDEAKEKILRRVIGRIKTDAGAKDRSTRGSDRQ